MGFKFNAKNPLKNTAISSHQPNSNQVVSEVEDYKQEGDLQQLSKMYGF